MTNIIFNFIIPTQNLLNGKKYKNNTIFHEYY